MQGAWVEIPIGVLVFSPIPVAPSCRGRGLKYVDFAPCLDQLPSPPHAGGVG